MEGWQELALGNSSKAEMQKSQKVVRWWQLPSVGTQVVDVVTQVFLEAITGSTVWGCL